MSFGRVVLEFLDYLLRVDLAAVSDAMSLSDSSSVSGCTVMKLKSGFIGILTWRARDMV